MNKQLENSDCPLLSKEGQAEPFGSSLLELAKAARQRGLKTHSGQVQRGDVFVALPGVKVNGAKFMQQALQAGAFAIQVTLRRRIHVMHRLAGVQHGYRFRQGIQRRQAQRRLLCHVRGLRAQPSGT